MSEAKAKETSIGVLRVLALMGDGEKHGVQDICAAAGGPGGYATEGLRRMRELRKQGFTVERTKVDEGTWLYSIKREVTAQAQQTFGGESW